MARIETLAVGDGRIEYAWFRPPEGANPLRAPIVFLHHGFGCVADWHDFPARVARATGHPTLAFSRLNCGGSSIQTSPRDHSYLHVEAREMLPRILHSLSIERCHLYGHSDGASIVLIFAGDFPERTLPSIVEAPHVFAESVTLNGVAQLADRFAAAPDLRKRLSKWHRDPDAAFYGWADPWRLPAFRDWTIEDDLPRIRTKLLVLQGTEDPYGTMAHAQRINQAICERAEIIAFPRCGHSPHHEQPDKVLEHLQGFMRGSMP